MWSWIKRLLGIRRIPRPPIESPRPIDWDKLERERRERQKDKGNEADSS